MTGTLIKRQCEESNHPYSCPVCDIRVKNVYYIYHENNREHKILRCGNCGFMFARPLFLQRLEDRKLDHEYDAELLNSASLRKIHEKLIIGKEIKYVKKILGKGAFSLLDIGCGTGWTTNMWAISGFDATGLEPSELRAGLASERYKIRVLTDYFENLDISETFDVVILRHMVEHFADPYKMMAKARSLLRPQGTAVIVVPNINCIGRYLFGAKWTWGIPYHCNFFNPKTLSHLLERAGFEIIRSYQTPSPLSYPESLLRFFPCSRQLTAKIYNRLNIFSLLPSVPLVILGYLMRLSENITVIARADRSLRNDI